MKTIKNDNLRIEIIELYKYHYKILELLENETIEFQDFQNYFQPINQILFPYIKFDEKGHLQSLIIDHALTETEKKEILSYLWRMEMAKNFKLLRYDGVSQKLKIVQNDIETELK